MRSFLYNPIGVSLVFFFLWMIPSAYAVDSLWTLTFLPLPASDTFDYGTDMASPSDYVVAFNPSGGNENFVGYSTSAVHWTDIFNHSTPSGKWTVVEFNPGVATDCEAGNLTTCRASTGFVKEHSVCLTDNSDCTAPATLPLDNYDRFSTSTQIVDNPTQDLFNGWIVFSLYLFGTIFYLKPRKI